jgi:hypothetical protein
MLFRSRHEARQIQSVCALCCWWLDRCHSDSAEGNATLLVCACVHVHSWLLGRKAGRVVCLVWGKEDAMTMHCCVCTWSVVASVRHALVCVMVWCGVAFVCIAAGASSYDSIAAALSIAVARPRLLLCRCIG